MPCGIRLFQKEQKTISMNSTGKRYYAKIAEELREL
jgi:hypothetical protein